MEVLEAFQRKWKKQDDWLKRELGILCLLRGHLYLPTSSSTRTLSSKYIHKVFPAPTTIYLTSFFLRLKNCVLEC